MSDYKQDIADYVRKYADDYCNGDIDEALNHIIVKLVIKEKETEDGCNTR